MAHNRIGNIYELSSATFGVVYHNEIDYRATKQTVHLYWDKRCTKPMDRTVNRDTSKLVLIGFIEQNNPNDEKEAVIIC